MGFARYNPTLDIGYRKSAVYLKVAYLIFLSGFNNRWGLGNGSVSYLYSKIKVMSVNLTQKLMRARQSDGSEILAKVAALLEENQRHREMILANLSRPSQINNLLKFDLLETDRIFHLRHIRKICIDYRLRFLESSQFRQEFPQEAISAIRRLEQLHGITLSGFRIAAPAKAFSLDNYNDPLLFVPIGNGYYYLVHQWGKELSAVRKWLVYPLRSLGWFTAFCLALTAITTLILPTDQMAEKIPMAGTIIFLFAFKSLFFVLMWGFFMTGRQFNAQAWDSRFYNG